jgi:putative inorganic carbon (hco3(-)) transporter
MCNRTQICLPSSLTESWRRAAFLALAGSTSLTLISIAASQLLLAVAILGTAVVWKREGKSGSVVPAIVWPLGLFFVWTILAALTSSDVRLGLTIVKKFYLFLLLLIVPRIVRGPGRTVWIYRAVFAASVVASALGVVQFAADPRRDLLHRISGFMSQWMTYSGLLMLVLVALLAYAFCYGWGRKKWVILLGLLITAALMLTYTRSAWLGAVAGLMTVILLRRPRLMLAVIPLLLLAFFVLPSSIQRRFESGWNPRDPNTRNRIELFETSMRLIKDHPWFGVGPKNVGQEALRYRGTDEFPSWMYQHMHNNFLQIAAERGIPGLLFWIWLMGALAWNALRAHLSARKGPALPDVPDAKEALMVSTAALGAWMALLVAGMFEYNFGDSEVLTLFLFIMIAPAATFGGPSGCDPDKAGRAT